MRKHNTKQSKSWLPTTAGKDSKTPAPVRMAIVLFISCVLVCPHAASAWWFNESDQDLLHKALSSENPRTVERCLDKFIKQQNYSAIMQVKHHARTMLLAERRKINAENRLHPENVKKHLAPWVRIEQKANQFFKRIPAPQQNAAP